MGNRIKELRTAHNMSQKALGDLIGLPQGEVSELERGKRVIDIRQWGVLADYFRVTVEYIAGLDRLAEKNSSCVLATA